jgi:hypothetical protein
MSVSNFAIVRQLDTLTVFTKQTALAQFLAVFFCGVKTKNGTRHVMDFLLKKPLYVMCHFPGMVLSGFTQLQTICSPSKHLFEAVQEVVGLSLGETERREEAEYVG